MRVPYTLARYIIRQLLANIGIVMSVLITLILVFDTLEIVRRAYDKNVPFSIVLEMVIMKLPYMLQKILPFAVLIGSIMALSKLTRSSELIIARASGVSVWQFLAPALITCMAIGIFIMTIFNPLSATMLSRFQQVEARYLRGTTSMLSVSSSGLWLRQSGTNSGEHIIHALRVSNSDMQLFEVTIFVFGTNNLFQSRIDADSAKLEDGYWQLKNAVFTESGKPARRYAAYRLPTDLSARQIQESFAPPETLSFWELPGFIHTLEEAGFSALQHRLYWNNILATPFFLMAMVFVAAIFSLRPPRQGKTGLLIVMGISSGFLIYFFSDVIGALALSGRIPVILAAWAPVGITMLVSIATTLHLEDG